MIIETEVEFYEDCDCDPALRPVVHITWARMCVDLCKVVAISELIEGGKLIHGVTQISMIGLGTWTVNEPYDKFKKMWKDANPELKFAIN